MYNKLLALFSLALGLQACQGPSAASLVDADTRGAENLPQATMQLDKYSYDVAKMAAKLKAFQEQKKEEYLPLVTVNAQGQHFFVAAKKPFDYDYENYFKNAGAVGLYDENGKLILPIAYEALGNLNAAAKDWMEVKQKGRWGLFQPSKGQLTAIEYDVIYPYPFDPNVLAQVRKGTQFGWLDASGKANFDPNSHSDKRLFQSPIQSGLAKQWLYSKHPEHLLPYVQGNDGDPEFGFECFAFVPHYWVSLGISKPQFQFRSMPGGEEGEGVHKGEIKIKEIKEVDGFSALIAEMDESGIMARSYHLQEDAVVIVDKQGQKTGSQTIGKGDANVCQGSEYLRFLSDRLIEVKRLSNVSEEENPFGKYKEMTVYRYYEINAQGEVKPLNSPRVFDCTKYAKMDESYFAGCQAALDDRKLGPDEGGMPLLLQEYLSPEDLDLMRNEIYAEYGLKFKTDKWKKYFSQQDWYQGRYDNVDDKLTETDKHNIQVILKMKEAIEKDKKRYQKTTKATYVAAG
jgi:hypothetical protein